MRRVPPEGLGTQVPEKLGSVGFQLFTSSLPATRGWFANHSLQPRKRSGLSFCR
jgi:hypothetical protein